MFDLLQSAAWEQFQRALGRRTWRVDGTLIIAMSLPFGLRYLYAPRGVCSPASSRPNKSASERRDLVQGIGNIARETSAVFLRAEFPTPPSPPSPREGGKQEPRLVPPRVLRRAIEPEWTWRVSLEPDEDAMFAGMHEKHRYNIRLAQRHGVAVRVECTEEQKNRRTTEPKPFDMFWSLLQETAKRQGIGTHPRTYYETMLRTLVQSPTSNVQPHDTQCKLYLAERDGEPLAAAIIAYHSNCATYLHGGSSHAQRQHMAPHLLHWQAMRDAKRAGMRWYDFGGVEGAVEQKGFRASGQETSVAPALKPSGPQALRSSSPQALRSSWSGMTRFKQGFGGEVVYHPPTRDLVFRRGWYTILTVLAKLRP